MADKIPWSNSVSSERKMLTNWVGAGVDTKCMLFYIFLSNFTYIISIT